LNKFVEGEDYYFSDDGLMILTKEYLLRRRYCCGKKCLNCPYDHINVPKNGDNRLIYNRNRRRK